MTEKNLFDDPKLKDGQYIVRIVGAVFDPKTKKVLLGKRENDPYIDGLTWCFPGSRTKSSPLTTSLPPIVTYNCLMLSMLSS